MNIEFTQYLLPDGRQQQIRLQSSLVAAQTAAKLIEKGVRFEVEILTTGEASFEALRDADGEPESLAMEIVPNGPANVAAIERLVLCAAAELHALEFGYCAAEQHVSEDSA